MDNIHLAQELMQGYADKKNSLRCTIKIDLCKAYDTIDYDFLRTVLNGLNFHLKFMYWVMQCVSSPRFSIAINDSPYGFFEGKRGIRQGDPMSPSLFIFCMEYLSRLLVVRISNNDFHYHAECARKKITYLAFADDLMLFGRGDFMSMTILAYMMQ
ncbi:rhamnogalacturonan endolyase [Salvia divinorum]|uniref:Rhamnogalacturonan endolyase n=1 Tax=Salvia divinorum TaxID=28513 RepID=A0ABD1H089_SALDI